MEFLYAIPHWAMGLLVVAATTGGSLAVYGAFHARRRKLTSEEVAMGPAFAGIIATVTSLLLAFTAVSVWDSFKSADDAAENEATTATMLARDLAIFGTPGARQTRERLREYLMSVEENEWPLLADGGISDDSRRKLDEIFRAAARIDPKTIHQQVVAQEIWGRLNELAKHRRERLTSARARVPDTLWAVVLIGTMLTVFCACTLPPNAFGWTMMTLLSASFGLCFFFIVAMDRPFAGRERVEPEAIHETLDNMTFWDKTERTSSSAVAGRKG